MAEDAYSDFRRAATAPLVQIDDNLFPLELFHGPTLAFKDFAMQWLGRADEPRAARARRRATILGATSGDTGAAAIEAFGGRSQTDVFILYPQGRVSDVQRRQMTTVDKTTSTRWRSRERSTIASASSRRCSTILPFATRWGFRASTRSTGRASLRRLSIISSAQSLSARPIDKSPFAVPTGNFGDILAGYYAKRMGLPIERLIIATNENDILARALSSGLYKPRGVKATQSPSMDIQVSSNFERLLFEAQAAIRGRCER